jgi:hypothetical protein
VYDAAQDGRVTAVSRGIDMTVALDRSAET